MSAWSRPPDPTLTLLQLGAATVIAQTVLLREAMAALAGSELAWGVVLGLWLVGMGGGARLGARFGSVQLARSLPMAVLAAVTAGVMLLRAAPLLAGATAGEALTTWQSLWIWCAAVVPAAFLGGFGFPALADHPAAGGAAPAYASEATGALLGGVLFTFVLAPLGTVAAVCLSLGLVTVLRCWRRWWLAGAVLLVAVWLAVVGGGRLARLGWQWSGRPGELVAWAETRHQQLLLGGPAPLTLYAGGKLIASYPDPYRTAPRAHLLGLLHPRPHRVLLSGGLADGTVQYLLRHPVRHLQLVEEDPALVQLLPTWYGEALTAALADARVRTGSSDLARALTTMEQWDLILLLGGNPCTLHQNRRLSFDLLKSCRDRLADDGLLVLSLDVSDTYLGGAAGRLLGITVATLRRLLPFVAALPGEPLLVVAGSDEKRVRRAVSSRVLADRWRSSRIDDPLLIPEMLPLLVDERRIDELATTLTELRTDDINTINRPRAVLLGAGLAEARGQPPLLRMAQQLERRSPAPLLVALGAAMLLLVLVAVLRPTLGGVAAGTVLGFASMGWWLLLLAAWQATRGSVYAEVGVLSALFMAGLAGGALVARSWQKPAGMLRLLLASGAVLSLAIASGLPVLAPRLVVPLLLAAGGFLTGAAFAGVARLAGQGSTRRGAAFGFAADEVGGAGAALLIGLLALPWAGSRASALGIAGLLLAALPVAARGR